MTRRCSSSTPAWCPSSRTSWERLHLPTRVRRACRSACAPSTSRRWARRPVMPPSSRWRATSRSAITSRRARSPSPGICSRAASPTAASASLRTSSGSPSTTTMTKRQTSGTSKSECRASASSAEAPRTTTGRWAYPDPVGPARRSTTTAVRRTDSRVALSSTRIATSRCGISSSCRRSSRPSARRRTSTS